MIAEGVAHIKTRVRAGGSQTMASVRFQGEGGTQGGASVCDVSSEAKARVSNLSLLLNQSRSATRGAKAGCFQMNRYEETL